MSSNRENVKMPLEDNSLSKEQEFRNVYLKENTTTTDYFQLRREHVEPKVRPGSRDT